MCFVYLEKAYDCVPQWVLWGLLQKYGVQGHCYKPCSLSKTRVKAVSVFLAGSQTCFQRMFDSAGSCPLSQFLFVISMIRTQSTAGGEDTVEFVDFKIASLLFACCRNPDNGRMDGLLMVFAIYAIGHDHLIISMKFQLFPSGIILTNFLKKKKIYLSKHKRTCVSQSKI